MYIYKYICTFFSTTTRDKPFTILKLLISANNRLAPKDGCIQGMRSVLKKDDTSGQNRREMWSKEKSRVVKREERGGQERRAGWSKEKSRGVKRDDNKWSKEMSCGNRLAQRHESSHTDI